MKKLLLSLMGMAMVIPQIYSISVDEYIRQNGMPVANQQGYLDLSHKNLTDLEGLQNIPNIDQVNSLSLSHNQLQTLPAGAFTGLNNLRYLNLSYNQLQLLPVSIFNGLHNLEDIWLHCNKLKTLPTGIFNSLDNLKYLFLKDNPFNVEFLLTLPVILKSISTLRRLDHDPVVETLKSKFYRVYQPKSLLETTKKYLVENLTPENLEKLAQIEPTAFNLLPLSQEQKTAIFQQIAARLAETGDLAIDLLPLAAQQKAEIIAQNIDMYRNQLYKLSKEVLDLLPLTPQQRAGIAAQKRQMSRPPE